VKIDSYTALQLADFKDGSLQCCASLGDSKDTKSFHTNYGIMYKDR